MGIMLTPWGGGCCSPPCRDRKLRPRHVTVHVQGISDPALWAREGLWTGWALAGLRGWSPVQGPGQDAQLVLQEALQVQSNASISDGKLSHRSWPEKCWDLAFCPPDPCHHS